MMVWSLTEMAYCVRAPGYIAPSQSSTSATSPSASTTVTLGPPGPTHTGQPANCNKWHVVQSGDSCSTVSSKYDITLSQFYSWNPAVSTDCATNFWVGQAYCVGLAGPSTTTSQQTITTTSSPHAPGPTHTGQPANCNKWHLVQSGDSCGTVASKYGITTAQFYAWNPAVSKDCTANFWVGQAYCVGIGGTPTSSSSPSADATPSPVQAGNAVKDCNGFAQAIDGDACSTFADRSGISLEQLYTWNTLFKQDGSGCANNLWAGYWYCTRVQEKRIMPPVSEA